MKTSSIVAAAVLTVVSLNQAIAGGWIASARPNVVPLTRMVGVPINRPAASFGPVNRFGSFNHFSFANRFGPFGGFGFQRPFGQSGFFPLGYVAASLPYPSDVGEPPAPQIIWAPSYVTVVAAGPRCGYGGPKIIVVGAPARPTRAENLPIVIYGTHGGCV